MAGSAIKAIKGAKENIPIVSATAENNINNCKKNIDNFCFLFNRLKIKLIFLNIYHLST